MKTTVVGSYPVPEWLTAMPSEQALTDAIAVVLKTQERAGVDVVADGELYRFDINHPETNGMIEYFVSPLENVRIAISRDDTSRFAQQRGMGFRTRPAGVVVGALGEGRLDLPAAFRRSRSLTDSPIKFTLTGPHMLAKTLLDDHYESLPELSMAIADILASQVAEVDAEVVQIDEANIPGHPDETEWALEAINRVLDAVATTPAVHLCFGNYGGQTIQQGTWEKLIGYLSGLRCDHVLIELAHRGTSELPALKDVDSGVRFGLGVVDIKSNVVETPEEIARTVDEAVKVLGEDRLAYVNPDCGFWMLKRSVADRKIAALVKGRDLFAGL